MGSEVAWVMKAEKSISGSGNSMCKSPVVGSYDENKVMWLKLRDRYCERRVRAGRAGEADLVGGSESNGGPHPRAERGIEREGGEGLIIFTFQED